MPKRPRSSRTMRPFGGMTCTLEGSMEDSIVVVEDSIVEDSIGKEDTGMTCTLEGSIEDSIAEDSIVKEDV